MNVEEFRSFCLGFSDVSEEFPFGPDTLVYKVMGKIFALAGLDEFVSVNLKCDPDRAVELREQYAAVLPGYHMNKAHWNTIMMDGSIGDKVLKTWISDSYHLVRLSPKKGRKP